MQGEITGGADRAVSFTVSNYGGPARYRVVATVGGDVLARVEPPAIDLAANGEQRVTVWLPASTIAAAGTSLELLVVVSSDDPSQPSENGAVLRLTVTQP